MTSEIQAGKFEYQVGDESHIGYLALNTEQTGRRPAIFVIHEWWGINDYIQRRVRQLAELGYVAFAVDMYGGGRTAANPEEAAALMNGVLGDMETGTDRLKAAFDTVAAMSEVDANRMAAIGYCFGGAMVLHMARIGMPLRAVASFHGALGSFHKPQPGEVKARILVCHGASDAMVSADDVTAFEAEMQAAEANFKVIAYPGAAHGFTNPETTEKGKKYGLPIGYDEQADQSSWQSMNTMFSEVLN